MRPNLEPGKGLGTLEVVDLRVPSAPRQLALVPGAGRDEVSARYGHDMVVVPGAWGGIKVYDVEKTWEEEQP